MQQNQFFAKKFNFRPVEPLNFVEHLLQYVYFTKKDDKIIEAPVIRWILIKNMNLAFDELALPKICPLDGTLGSTLTPPSE